MVNRKFEKYFRHVAYSYDEILSQVHKLQERYEVVTYKSQKDSFVVYIRLRPTNESITYTVKVCCRVGASKVNIYVVNPQIGRREKVSWFRICIRIVLYVCIIRNMRNGLLKTTGLRH